MREKEEKKSACTVNALLHASHLAYHYTGNPNKKMLNHHDECRKTLSDSGYEINHELTTFRTNPRKGLGAVVLEPSDPEQPIILAFRGTVPTRNDLASDLNIMATGGANAISLQDANNFYQKVRDKYPNRMIVLTGHSLGGHFAQAVGCQRGDNVMVRTFNTAPCYGEITKPIDNPAKQNKFINYRLENDPVSMMQRRVGDTFSMPAKIGYAKSHSIVAMKESFPPDLLACTVGGTQNDYQSLKERIIAVKYSYQSRIDGQLFSSFRQGSRKNELLQKELSSILEMIDNPEKQAKIIPALMVSPFQQ